MRFSIAIIHRNDINILRKATQSVEKYSKSTDEIIIVDNNSDDNSLKYFKSKKNIKIISNDCNAGYGAACNQAISISQGKYILLCNNDIEIYKDTLDDFEKTFKNKKNAGLIGPQMLSVDGSLMRSYVYKKPHWLQLLDLFGRPFKNHAVHELSQVAILRGACLAVRKDMLDDVEAFDEDLYFYHEETEWCLRINKSKFWRVYFNPDIVISHIGGYTTNNMFLGSRIEFFRSRLIYWRKSYPLYVFLILLSWNIPKLFIDLIFYFVLSLLTLFINEKYRKKLLDRFIVLLWLLFFMPKNWGLKDKCPRKTYVKTQ